MEDAAAGRRAAFSCSSVSTWRLGRWTGRHGERLLRVKSDLGRGGVLCDDEAVAADGARGGGGPAGLKLRATERRSGGCENSRSRPLAVPVSP